MLNKFPFYRQYDGTDCGPTCLRMIVRHYGKVYPIEFFRERCQVTRYGVSFMGISEAAESIGIHSFSAKVTYDVLTKEAPLPCIVHWRQRHFVVVYKAMDDTVYVADPMHSRIKYSREEFLDGWTNGESRKSGLDKGLVLLLEPTPQFNEQKDFNDVQNSGLASIFPYFKPFKSYINQLVLGLVVSTVLQFILPFLTQSVVDRGIRYQNLNFVQLVLIGQIIVFISELAVTIIRSWLLLHLGARINIAISSDFISKMMKLPLSFFDSKNTGDVMQRVEDNQRLERFLSSQSLNALFSVINVIVFTSLLFYYNWLMGIVFLSGSLLYLVWIYLFMKRRAVLDFRRFDELSTNSTNMIQMIHGMPEIKLNGSERRRRWEWEAIQIRLYNISVKSLSIAQYQSSGGTLINELKNIIITFIAATSVIGGQMTLGMMLAVQYILGQLNVPLNSFLLFIQGAQDARISIDRISEIHRLKSEDEDIQSNQFESLKYGDIHINKLNFRYGPAGLPLVIKDLNTTILKNRVTAIVGVSGSGKTTLIKLLLKFYDPLDGAITIDKIDLKNINASYWRSKCGVVMQDGFIFTDTILKNITESDPEGITDVKRLNEAIEVANIQEFISRLPAGFNTRIGPQGTSGVSLSGGQKQRILIARAVYKNPEYLFFDEATSSLDANNELVIMQNLEKFFLNRTVVVIAHRLSTVKNADKILFMDQGRIVEEGSHEYLISLKGKYYTLVKNQLELGE